MKIFREEIVVLLLSLLFITAAGLAYYPISKTIQENRKEQEFLNTQVVTIIDKEYKEPYNTTIMMPAMVGKAMVMRPQITHHSAQYILHVKLDDGRMLKINTFKLAYETVEIGKRYKYKDL